MHRHLLLFFALFVFGSAFAQLPDDVRNGDIIFQTSKGEMGKAIQVATNSRYSHVGIIYIEDGQPMVFEAVQPVGAVPLADWIARGRGGHYVVKRLKDADTKLTPSMQHAMFKTGQRFNGLDYDGRFEWSDRRMYCSELVWKIYHRCLGIRIGEPAPLRSYTLDDPLVQKRLEMHYGGNIPMDEMIISPQAMFDSELLVTVIEGPGAKKNFSRK